METLTGQSLTGHQLKALRRAQRISQTVMAERIGCSRYAVSYWETKLDRIRTSCKRGLITHRLTA